MSLPITLGRQAFRPGLQRAGYLRRICSSLLIRGRWAAVKRVYMTVSVCLYLKGDDIIPHRNIRSLSKYLESRKEHPFEVIVAYRENRDISRLTKKYPHIRWQRIVKEPRNPFFLYRYLAQKIRSEVFIFVSHRILLGIPDIFSLANNALKKNVLLSYLRYPRCLYLPSHQRRLRDRFGHVLNRLRSEIYTNLNKPVRLSSLEFFAVNLSSFQKAVKKMPAKEKYHLFRGRFGLCPGQKGLERMIFDFSLSLLAFRSKTLIDSPGKAMSRWFIPTRANFFPMFMSYRQLFLLFRMAASTGYGLGLVNYKRFFLLASHLAFLSFFVMSYAGYQDAWYLLVFFLIANIPLLTPSPTLSWFSPCQICKLFLILF